MKNYTKEELLNLGTLIIENEITCLDLENLNTILAEERENHVVIIFKNMTEGNFRDSSIMGKILSDTKRKVNIISDGNINLTGIIPIISSNSVLSFAKENTNFIIDVNKYFDNYVDYEVRKDAYYFIKYLLYECTNLLEIEIPYLLNKRTVIDSETAYKYGFINDIYRSNPVNDVSSLESLQRFQKDSDLTLERRIREKIKSSNCASIISHSIN